MRQLKVPRRLALPALSSLDGSRPRNKGVTVTTGKPPKLRFKPGTEVKWEGKRYQVLYAYRVKENPHEWVFCIEELRPMDTLAMLATLAGFGEGTPRVVYEIFRDHGDAQQFFIDIPANGDRCILSNKKLLAANR